MKSSHVFNANLIVTDASGEYYGVRSTLRLSAYSKHFQIGQYSADYDKLIKLEATGNRLYIQFVDSKGKSCEKYLKYNTFWPSTALKRLQKLVADVKPLLPKSEARIVPAVLTNETKETPDGFDVTVYSSKVSFPPICPVCANIASTVTKFEVTSVVPTTDLLKIGYWLIPVCPSHKKLIGHLKVKNWSPSATEAAFSFKNKTYLEEFLRLNRAPQDQRNPKAQNVTEKIMKLKGKRFVLYEYYNSAFFFGFLNVSDVQELRPDENRFLRGLKYNAITLTAGWWSFPFGPVYTVTVLLKNLIGGIDVSDHAVAVFQGKPFAAVDD